MSRSSRSRNTRDVRYIAKPGLSFLPRPTVTPSPSLTTVLQQVQDRRVFHPDGLFRPAVTRNNVIAPIVSSNPRSRRLPVGTAFSQPDQVLTCVRRKRRREVLFARGGAGSRRMRRPRHSYYSSVRC